MPEQSRPFSQKVQTVADGLVISNNTFAWGAHSPIVLYRGMIGPGAHGIRNVTIQNNLFYQPYPGYPAVAAPEDDRFLENIVIRNNSQLSHRLCR